MAEFTTVGRADEVAEGQVKAFEVAGQLVAVTRVGGRPVRLRRHLHAPRLHSSTPARSTARDRMRVPRQRLRHDDRRRRRGAGRGAEPTFPVRDEGGELQIEA